MGATYRGVHSKEFGLHVRTNPPLMPEHDNDLLEIPGMHGAHYGGSQFKPAFIPLEIIIVEKDAYSYAEKLRMVSDWLRPDEGLGEYIADDEPNKTYYAVLDKADVSRIAKIARAGEGTIELICPDPFAYGKTITKELSDEINNEGTAETYPIFDLNIKKQVELAYIGNLSNLDEFDDKKSIYIGTDVSIDEPTKPKRQLVMHDTMQSTSGWTGASNVDSGTVTGRMGTDSEGFYVEEWGDEDEDGKKPEWIGPSLERSLDNELDSFQADIRIANRNEFDKNGKKILAGVGIIEVYFRDINDKLVAKMMFGDSHGSSMAKNNGTIVVDDTRESLLWKPSGYNDFNGMIRIRRDSGGFKGYVASMTASGQHYKITETQNIYPKDGLSNANNKVKKIQVAIRKYIGAQRIYQRIKEIKVWDILGLYDFPDDKKVEKLEVGDKLHINTGTGLISLNGEPRIDLRQFGTRMFSLVPGINELDYTSSEIEGTVTYPERFL